MPDPLFRSIAVAIDGSESATSALRIAIAFAARDQAPLAILAIAPLAPVFVAPNEPFVPPAIPESRLPKFQEIVQAAVREAEAAGVEKVTGVSEEGVVVDEILAYLETHPTDLLVVGSRGLSTAKRLLLGSGSTALINRAPCPVLVVRPSATKPPG
jgi:nucleotide-binding universal stress UspA family protein